MTNINKDFIQRIEEIQGQLDQLKQSLQSSDHAVSVSQNRCSNSDGNDHYHSTDAKALEVRPVIPSVTPSYQVKPQCIGATSQPLCPLNSMFNDKVTKQSYSPSNYTDKYDTHKYYTDKYHGDSAEKEQISRLLDTLANIIPNSSTSIIPSSQQQHAHSVESTQSVPTSNPLIHDKSSNLTVQNHWTNYSEMPLDYQTNQLNTGYSHDNVSELSIATAEYLRKYNISWPLQHQ